MLLLILESLGSTELLFILVMALVFFGPRKLPQLSRKLGKSLAEFRRASEDFKSTWEREVQMESSSPDAPATGNAMPEARSLFDNETAEDPMVPMIHPVSPEENVAREPGRPSENVTSTDPVNDGALEANPSEPPQKREWL